MSIREILLKHNGKQSESFIGSDGVLLRQHTDAHHSTAIAVFECMDGRVSLGLATEMPLGAFRSFRNIGGQFDMGWPYFGTELQKFVDEDVAKGKRCLLLISYHFSASDKHLGCRGFGYDTAGAKRAMLAFAAQIEKVFGKNHSVVYPVVVGFETDEDTLVIHGAKGETLDLGDKRYASKEELKRNLTMLFPDMHPHMMDDFLSLIEGNIRHIDELQVEPREGIDLDHREQVLAVGEGFEWLTLANKALTIGPYSYNIRAPIATAGKIMLENFEKGRVSKRQQAIVLISTTYRGNGPQKQQAAEKAQSLAEITLDTMKTEVPQLKKYFAKPLIGVVNLDTFLFEPLKK